MFFLYTIELMKTLKTTYFLELQRTLNKRTVGLFFIIALLSLYLVQTGINNFKSGFKNQKTFQDFESLKVKQYVNYNQYGAYGFRIVFLSSPLSIYFVNSSAITELTANIDSGERLNLYNSFKGKGLFLEKTGGFKDFSGIMLLLGSLFILYLGYEAFIYKDYLRFMAGFVDYKRLFFSVVLSRIMLLLFFILFIGGISFLLLKLNGIYLSMDELFHWSSYLGILVLLMLFFFFLGAIAGAFKSNFSGFIMLIFSWFIFVFLIPGGVNSFISQKADNLIPDYQLELEKLKILMDFERYALKKMGVTTEENKGDIKKMMEDYLNSGFKQIQQLEEGLEKEMSKNIHRFQCISACCPSTFYLSVGNELSGKGYENFIGFFKYSRELKMKFVRFYINQRYSTQGPMDGSRGVSSFIKQNENLFYGQSMVPRTFFMGLVVMGVYIMVLGLLAYLRFLKSMEQ